METFAQGLAFIYQKNMKIFQPIIDLFISHNSEQPVQHSARTSRWVMGRGFVPLVLFGVVALAYGWQLNRLGFYWDDWVFVYRYQTLGLFNTIFYGGTRQLGVLAFLPGFLLAGDSPLLWHLYSLLLRWVVTLLFWWVLDALWPGQKTSVTLMAALFAVHPAFSQQSIAVVYSLQFFNYAVILISFGSMIKFERSRWAPWLMETGAGVRGFPRPAWRWIWFGIAILAQSLHLFLVEYFVGLELIRPLIIYLLQGQSKLAMQGRLQRLKTTFMHWLPFLLILFIYAIWRSGLFGAGFDTYEYKTITSFLRVNPQAAISEIFEYGLKDILVLLVNTWHATLAPSLIDFSQPYNFFSIVVAAISAAGLYFLLSRPGFDPARESSQVLPTASQVDDRQFMRQAAVLGFFAVLVSFIPSWFVRRHIVEPGNFGDRFALAGLFGASILLVIFARYFSGRSNKGILLATLFIGLATGAQIRFENTYRWDWERQLRTYWQVSWRVPALQPGSVLVGYDAISTTTVNYVGAFALNELYLPAQPPSAPAVWYVNYPKTPIAANLDKFLAGDWFYTDQFDNISVAVHPNNSLGLDYTEGRCVRILTPDDLANYNLPDDFRPVAGFSNPALVTSKADLVLSRRIFGSAPLPGWCYYFEKAELARQSLDWDRILVLKKEADKAAFEPLDAYELFPFIEANLMRSDWGTAQKLSMQAYKSLPKSLDGVCLIWKRVGQQAVSSSVREEYQGALQQVNTQLGCR